VTPSIWNRRLASGDTIPDLALSKLTLPLCKSAREGAFGEVAACLEVAAARLAGCQRSDIKQQMSATVSGGTDLHDCLAGDEHQALWVGCGLCLDEHAAPLVPCKRSHDHRWHAMYLLRPSITYECAMTSSKSLQVGGERCREAGSKMLGV
jgi:hypothetical protein